MKVLQINTSVNTGSTGRIAEEIGKKLVSFGYESHIAFSKKGPSGSSSNLIQIGSTADVYIHALKTRLLDAHGFGSTQATKKLVMEICKIDPDLIGLHNLHGYYLNIKKLFSYLKNVQKPIVWTFHDCWPFTGHCSHFDYVSCDKWKTECHECPLSGKYPASWFVDNSRENFHRKKDLFNGLENLTIITPSHWLKNLVGQSFLSNYRVEVVHNGIDLDQFKPVDSREVISKYHLSEKKILLGVANVWDRIKGLNYFVELSRRLDDSFRIVLIGLSEEKSKGLPENIVAIQRTENIDELVSFYNIADMYINPTLADNFPTTNLEALACGTPVVTFDTGGSPEAVDEQTGIVVEKGNMEQLLEAVDKILSKSTENYQNNCRNRAIALYDKEERYSDYMSIYENMLNGKKL